MQLGMIGLGRMGANIVRRVTKAGHACVVYDRDPKPGEALAKEGATAATSLEDSSPSSGAARHLGDAAGGRGDGFDDRRLERLRQSRRRHHRRRQFVLARRHPPRPGAGGRASISSTSAPAAASGVWSAAIA